MQVLDFSATVINRIPTRMDSPEHGSAEMKVEINNDSLKRKLDEDDPECEMTSNQEKKYSMSHREAAEQRFHSFCKKVSAELREKGSYLDADGKLRILCEVFVDACPPQTRGNMLTSLATNSYDSVQWRTAMKLRSRWFEGLTSRVGEIKEFDLDGALPGGVTNNRSTKMIKAVLRSKCSPADLVEIAKTARAAIISEPMTHEPARPSGLSILAEAVTGTARQATFASLSSHPALKHKKPSLEAHRDPSPELSPSSVSARGSEIFDSDDGDMLAGGVIIVRSNMQSWSTVSGVSGVGIQRSNTCRELFRCSGPFRHPEIVVDASFKIMAIVYDNEARDCRDCAVFNLANMLMISTIQSFQVGCCPSLSRTGALLFGAEGTAVRAYNTSTGRVLWMASLVEFMTTLSYLITAVECTPDDKCVLVLKGDVIVVIDAESGLPLRRLAVDSIITSFAVCREQPFVAVSYDDGCLKLWDYCRGQYIPATPTIKRRRSMTLLTFAENSILIRSSRWGEIECWIVHCSYKNSVCEAICTFKFHVSVYADIDKVMVNKRNGHIVVAGKKGNIIVLDGSTGDERMSIPAPMDPLLLYIPG
jgi:WD40 repeat protein